MREKHSQIVLQVQRPWITFLGPDLGREKCCNKTTKANLRKTGEIKAKQKREKERKENYKKKKKKDTVFQQQKKFAPSLPSFP